MTILWFSAALNTVLISQANDSVQLSYYLRNGVSPNLTFQGRDPVLKLRYSCLHLCCQKGHYDCAKCLIDHGKMPLKHNAHNVVRNHCPLGTSFLAMHILSVVLSICEGNTQCDASLDTMFRHNI